MDVFGRLSWSHPCVCLAFLLLPSVYVPGAWLWAAAVLATASAVSFVRGEPHRRTAVVAAAGAVLCLVWGWRSVPPEPVWPFSVAGSAEGLGTVTAEAAVSRQGSVPFQLRIDEVRSGLWAGRASAVVTVAGYRGPPPATGSRWSWSGRLDGGRLLWGTGRQEGWADEWWSARAGARQDMRRLLAPLGPAPAALSEALVIGAVDDLTPWEKDSFRLAGCSHVLALSGMHLSLLALVLTTVFHRRAPPAVVFWGIQAVLAAFCFLAGPIPSLLRAWVMAFLAGWWTMTRRTVPLTELLAQAFVVSVLLWPDLAPTLSLQLTFLAMAGLFWWSRPCEWALRPLVGRWAAAELGTSAAAMAATVPLTLALFGEVRWIGLVMTPPLVFLTTLDLVGAVAVLLAGAAGLDMAFAAPAFQLLYDATFGCTAWASGFPAIPALPALVGIVLLGAALVFLYNKRHRRMPLPSLNYDSPAALQAFLNDKGYNTLKRWGQNFLINAGARRQILAALELKPGEPVWEVGPGLGALTHHLVEAGHPVTVFEIDPGYAAFLREEFGRAPGFSVVEGDVVKTWKTAPDRAAAGPGIKTVGNLPYNAASAIVADFIEGGFFPAVFVVTVQLEMAQRMAAPVGNKNYSSFSVLCQSVFRVEDVVTLRPGSFYPAPEVTSRVVRLRPHGLYPALDRGRFSSFVRECFSSRRKTLRNNLPRAAAALHVSDESLTAAFAKAGVDLGRRAETLPVAEFVAVYEAIGKNG
jgi:16S rRNA (adenine1518-N6/adenine1519-N6)-dimethyltransferase